MGQDENKNNFGGASNAVNSAATPTKPNAALEELRRISADSNPNTTTAGAGNGFDSTAGGDIVIKGAPARRNNKKVILIILAIVAVIAIVVSVIVTRVVPNVFKNPVTDSDFVDYLLNGDVDINTTEEKPEKAKLSDYANGEKNILPTTFYSVVTMNTRRDKKIEEYFTTLNEKYETFKKNNQQIDGAKIEKLDTLIEMLNYTVNYMQFADEYADVYVSNKGNLSSTKKYFEEKYVDPKDESLKEISDVYKALYEAHLEKVMSYDVSGCYQKEKTTFECVVATGNMALINNVNNSISKEATVFRNIYGAATKLSSEIVKLLMEIGAK